MTARIHKVIAASGLASRRVAEDMVRDGRVRVDGEEATIGQRIDPNASRVEVDGIVLPVSPGIEHHLVNKQAGVVSTARDTHGRPTVVDLVDSETRLWPVGRLDTDSEGLIIVTNDGTLTHRLTHPRFGVVKTYMVIVNGVLTQELIDQLAAGVQLEDGPAKPRRVRLVDTSGDRTMIEIEMTEGRNREVRRMVESIGFTVERLVRSAIGGLHDQRLRPGTARPLRIDEVRRLYEASGSAWQDDDPDPRTEPVE